MTLQSKCIRPGHWEIESFTVQQDETTGEWVVHEAFASKPVATVRTLTEAREWIAADLDSVDLGMSSGILDR